jgi:hypothetical protein
MGFLDRLRGRRRPPALDNGPLEALIRALAAGRTAALQARFHTALLEANLFVATPGVEGQGLPVGTVVVAAEPIAVRFVATRDDVGRGLLLAFTSMEAVHAWRPAGCDGLVLPARDLFATAARAGLYSVVLNPAGPNGAALAHAEFLSIAEGVVPAAAGDPTGERHVGAAAIRIERPESPPPPHLVEAIRTRLRGTPEIRAAYLVRASIGGGEAHAMLALELAAGVDRDAVMPPFLAALQAALPRDEYLDVLPLDDTRLAAAARDHGVSVGR